MKKLYVVVGLICLLFSGVAGAKGNVSDESYKTAYFGDESDYLPYFADYLVEAGVNQGVMVGWWYPSYEEFLGS
jgi:hypothetical protein